VPMSHIEAIRELNRSFEKLSLTALQVKKERDALVEACKSALNEMEHLEAHDHLSYFDLDKLKAAIKLAEGDK